MANLTTVERQAIVRQMALDLVAHMHVQEPPIWVENLLKNPPQVAGGAIDLSEIMAEVLDSAYFPSETVENDLLVPASLPLPERRFSLALGLLRVVMNKLYAQADGLALLILPNLQDSAEYFARVLLAPDPLVLAYRRTHPDSQDLAQTFLIPTRVANLRAQDLIESPLEFGRLNPGFYRS